MCFAKHLHDQQAKKLDATLLNLGDSAQRSEVCYFILRTIPSYMCMAKNNFSTESKQFQTNLSSANKPWFPMVSPWFPLVSHGFPLVSHGFPMVSPGLFKDPFGIHGKVTELSVPPESWGHFTGTPSPGVEICGIISYNWSEIWWIWMVFVGLWMFIIPKSLFFYGCFNGCFFLGLWMSIIPSCSPLTIGALNL